MTELEMANQLLKSLTTTSIRIVDRSGRLSLRISIPGQKQKRVALGLKTNIDGIFKALTMAFDVNAQIDNNDFDFICFSRQIRYKSLNQWIEDLEAYYFSINARSPQSETTWKGEYLKVFKKIKGDELTESALLDAIKSTKADSRTRLRICQACQFLADFAGLKCNFEKYKGKYSYKSVNPRLLPSDSEILRWNEKIPMPEWQWFYLMVVTYGLRPCECFQIFPVDRTLGIIQVEASKTGGKIRESYPLYPDWPGKFDLMNFKQPNITFRYPSDISERSGKYFGRQNLPFTCTDLRHCWARRASEVGLDPEIAAESLGHSLIVHQNIYKAWIKAQTYRRRFLEIVQR